MFLLHVFRCILIIEVSIEFAILKFQVQIQILCSIITLILGKQYCFFMIIMQEMLLTALF